MDEYNEMTNMLDRIEELFENPSFYFGYYVTIAIAQKKGCSWLVVKK